MAQGPLRRGAQCSRIGCIGWPAVRTANEHHSLRIKSSEWKHMQRAVLLDANVRETLHICSNHCRHTLAGMLWALRIVLLVSSTRFFLRFGLREHQEIV